MNYSYKNWGNAFYVRKVCQTVGKNLSLNKPAQQSSCINERMGKSQRAVNGVKNGKHSFHRKKEVNPWWQVDLKEICLLTEIRVYNQVDNCSDRARTLIILLSLDAKNWEQVYLNNQNYIFGGIDSRPLIVQINQKKARYVRLQLNEENCLHLDEVEVYGTPIQQ